MDKFYGDNIDLKYPEIAISLDDSSLYNRTIRFYIPILMPILNQNNAINNKIPKQSTSNIINKNNNIGISSCTTCNYITMTIPDYLYRSYDTEYNKGTKFIVIFVGGDINKGRIIGLF